METLTVYLWGLGVIVLFVVVVVCISSIIVHLTLQILPQAPLSSCYSWIFE